MAPEQAKMRKYTNLVDVWSAAMTMYKLLTNKHPLHEPHDTREEYFEKIKEQIYWVFPAYFPRLAKNLFIQLAKSMPLQRYSAEQALLHPWISRNMADAVPLTYFQKLQKYNDAILQQKIMKTVHFCSLVFFLKTKIQLNENYKAYVKFKSRTILQDEIEKTSESPQVRSNKKNTKKMTAAELEMHAFN